MNIPEKPSHQEHRSGHQLVAYVPEGEKAKVDDFLAQQEAGTFTPVQPRFASTVMIVRNAPDGECQPRYHSDAQPEDRISPANGIEVFMMRRQSSMAFLPDAVVFPGGRVDPADADPALPWEGPTPAQWAQRIGKDEVTTRQIIVAAIREVFEESGILLAGTPDGAILSDLSGDEWLQERKDLADHKQSFASMLIRRGLVLRSDLLCFHSNFITPEYLPKRFDTFFFSALCPEGQDADDKSRESYIADWVEPQWALDMLDKGILTMVPVTIHHVGMIARAQSLNDLMSADKVAKPFMFRPRKLEDGSIINEGTLA